MKQEINIHTWNRKEHFEFFSQFDEPFFSITCDINMTVAYEQAKKLKIPFFIYYLHKSLTAINSIENFKYRIEDKKVFLYDNIHVSATIMRDDKTFGFSMMHYHENLLEFNQMAQLEINRIQNTPGLLTTSYPENIIHFSAIPWINFTGLTHARNFSYPDSCPKISFGKLVQKESQKTMSLSLAAHHGLVDGYHMGLVIEKLQHLLDS
ncbi:chloramphenicol acetyltransferase [Flavobacterium sp. TP390]|uniref:Chloramphenicol acetyltransferase n=1 Tax=Flavobacterium profundi TaxID=1774945 RepID=A0A6I4IIL6_9FLAO|nr:chloramphenicol acetyltransferase [Flavobacterium profundi]MVO09560.1 chloramphenicol acetyltransferase [Flavobacterium profundi]